jgi:hypothetical protein
MNSDMPQESPAVSPADGLCAVCGKVIDRNGGLARIYHQGRSFTLCCPLCLQMFQRARDRFIRGERPQSVVEDLLDQIRWRERDL